jgi:hypothetical protein
MLSCDQFAIQSWDEARNGYYFVKDQCALPEMKNSCELISWNLVVFWFTNQRCRTFSGSLMFIRYYHRYLYVRVLFLLEHLREFVVSYRMCLNEKCAVRPRTSAWYSLYVESSRPNVISSDLPDEVIGTIFQFIECVVGINFASSMLIS